MLGGMEAYPSWAALSPDDCTAGQGLWTNQFTVVFVVVVVLKVLGGRLPAGVSGAQVTNSPAAGEFVKKKPPKVQKPFQGQQQMKHLFKKICKIHLKSL